MRRIQIVISADLPETNDKLADMEHAGQRAAAIKLIRNNISELGDLSVSEPQIVEVRAPRADKGTTRQKKSRVGRASAPVLADQLFSAPGSNPAAPQADNTVAASARDDTPERRLPTGPIYSTNGKTRAYLKD